MKRKGFLFACPTLTNDKDEVLEFQRFIKVPTTDSDRIYNPFPQTAYAGNYNQACTHPLLYLSYLPTIDYKQIQNPEKCILAAYYNSVTYVHEVIHILLAGTPAKIFARQVLAWAYACVNDLINEETWSEEAWYKLEDCNKQLTVICEAITPSEELLATAASFEMVNSIWREHFEEVTNALEKELENVEKQCISTHQNLSPDFVCLYYNTFKKITAWFEPENVVLHLISAYLQGIQKIRPEFEVVDSCSRLKTLAEKVNDMKNEAGLMDWIRQTVSGPEYELMFVACALVIGSMKAIDEKVFKGKTRSFVECRHIIGSCLWTLWQGSKPRIRKHMLRHFARTINLVNPSIFIRLIPHESEMGWCIFPRIDDRRTGTRAQRQAIQTPLPLESLRQQLDERKGICCPNYMSGRCQCELSWRKALWRLVQWAREDKFGAGEWRDLPPECSCGV